MATALVRQSQHARVALLPLISLVIGWLTVAGPVWAILLVAMPASLLLLGDGRLRTLFLVIGGLVVFQSSDELNMLKLAYLLGLGVCIVGALHHAALLRSSDVYRLTLPLLRASGGLLVLIVISLPVALTNGIPKMDWLRDVAPYVLVAGAPLFALDAQSSLTKRGLQLLLILGGLVAAASLSITWIERRGIAEVPGGTFAFPSLFLAGALFTYATAMALEGWKQRGRWLVLAAVVLALALLTGSRVNLLLLVAPLAIAVGARRHLAKRTLRLAIAGPIVVFATFLVFQAAVGFTGGRDSSVLAARQTLLFETGDVRFDQSYRERKTQAEAAWDVFKENPLIGVGPGYQFEWRNSAGELESSFNPDTILTFPANFGVAGLVVVIGFIVGYISFLKGLAKQEGLRTDFLSLVGYSSVIAAVSFQSPPFEEKGFALALILLGALALRRVSESGRLDAVRRSP